MSSFAINARLLQAFRRPDAKVPIRVGVTGLRGIPNVMGGIETHCEQLLPRIKNLRPSYDVVVMGRSPYLESDSTYRGVSVKRLFTIRNKYLEAIVHTFVSILYARLLLGCHVIHIHGIGPSLLTPLAVVAGLRVIVTHHGEDYNRDKWNRLARAVLRCGELLSVRYAQAVLVVSNDVAGRLKARHAAHRGKIHHVPNGAPRCNASTDRTAHRETLSRFGLAERDYVFAVGRLVPEKNFGMLVEAFKRANLDCDLVVAGAADHGDRYSAELLRKADQRVRFIGFQSQETLAVLYRGAGLFVLPSSHEGMPIAALEAASAGCPILLSDIKPNVELGLDGRNYFPVGDIPALARRLKQPFETYAIDWEMISARFDWDRIAERTIEVYDRVSQGDRSPVLS
ncbi:glycosyltransferase involved in cell wall biosynthesis [Methylorubrum rhodesianum]|uniref:glycosyltransferase family 4 protein n=1 Tax=Methylorubrum TaxID=2282523 RepID=UPI0016195BA3|nr:MULTISPECIES: glycosyltransferase family 4 protein [Methylorubrum]MBB5765736.1 glycosyltransferase involved in cell wall biosynthesis [Methylorubrum rhodesianum]MBI1691990.1 glycosyltransferase [Methylorubrum sp. DB1722]